MAKTFPRFDGTEAWHLLTKRQQDHVGRIALELVACAQTRAVADMADDPLTVRATEAAQVHLCNALDAAVVSALGVIQGVPVMVGDICEDCGCTQNDACPGGCCWVRKGLCSHCHAIRIEKAGAEHAEARQ